MPKKFIVSILIIISLFIVQVADVANVESSGADAYVVGGIAGLHLRQLPARDSTILLTMKADTPLTVKGRNSDSSWLLVQVPEGHQGWAARAYLYVNINLDAVAIITNPEAVPDLSVSADAEATPPPPPTAREIYLRGQQMGNRRNVFTTVGDSLTDSIYFLRQIPSGYKLRGYQYLLPTLQYFDVDTGYGNAYNRRSFAAHAGWTSFSVLDTNNSAPTYCHGWELPIHCEYRLVKPAVALIMIGTNDAPTYSVEQYQANLTQIIEISTEQGVVPVLSTLPSRADSNDKIIAYNNVIRDLAHYYNAPLWDFYYVVNALPNRGLGSDGIHLSLPEYAPASTMDFTRANLRYGATMRNLSALKMLKIVLETVMY